MPRPVHSLVRVGIVAVLLLVVLAPAMAQNSPGDECIITVALDDDLRTVRIAFDLLFNDTEWDNLTAAIDADGNGDLNATEIDAYEAASHGNPTWENVSADRRVNLGKEYDTGWEWGDSFVIADDSTHRTELIAFEGPADNRSGKIVREHWTHHFPNPAPGVEPDLVHAMIVRWGPDAAERDEASVAVVETVVVTPPSGWWVVIDGERYTAHTFDSGDGYTIRYEPDTPPRQPSISIDNGGPSAIYAGITILLLTGVAITLGLIARRVRRR